LKLNHQISCANAHQKGPYGPCEHFYQICLQVGDTNIELLAKECRVPPQQGNIFKQIPKYAQFKWEQNNQQKQVVSIEFDEH